MTLAPPTIISHAHSPSRVLKESVVRTKHFVREQIEPLPGHTPIVETFLSLELNVESRFQCFNIRHFHDEVIGVSKDVTATHWDVELIGNMVLGERRVIRVLDHEATIVCICTFMKNIMGLTKRSQVLMYLSLAIPWGEVLI